MYSMRPAETGIRFRRVDLENRPEIPATIAHLSERPAHPAFAHLPARCTTIEHDGASVALVEHVLSALAGLGVTDATIEIAGEEMPIFDGSSAPFVMQILGAGLRDLESEADPIVLRETIRVERGGAWIEATPAGPGDPANACVYTYELDYGMNPAIQAQTAEWTRTDVPERDRPREASYAMCVAGARTFCLEHEAVEMRRAGLFGHLGPGDMLVLGPMGPIDNDLRFEDEPARHKVLDLIGDLALAGRPIVGRIRAHKGGHALNHEMARRLAGIAP